MLNKRFFKTKSEYEVTFEYADENAQEVALVCEANNWEPVPMSKRKKDGVFFTKVRLPENSQYQFRYFVDGERWENDKEADAFVPNDHGTENSIVSTSAAA